MKALPKVREYLSDSERQNIVRVAEKRKEGLVVVGDKLLSAIDSLIGEFDLGSDDEFVDTTNVLIEQLEIENGEILKRIPPTQIVNGEEEIQIPQKMGELEILQIQLEHIVEDITEQYKHLDWIQKRVKRRGKVIPFPIKKRTDKLEEEL